MLHPLPLRERHRQRRLVLDHRGTACHLARWLWARWHPAGLTCEDFEAEALGVLVRVAGGHQYDPARGSFGAWVSRPITWGLLSLVRRQGLPHAPASCLADRVAPGRSLEDVAEGRELCELARRGLTERQEQLVQWYFDEGESLVRIGERLGLHRARVHQLMQEILEAMRRRLGVDPATVQTTLTGLRLGRQRAS